MAALGWLLNLDMAASAGVVAAGSNRRRGAVARRGYAYGYNYLLSLMGML